MTTAEAPSGRRAFDCRTGALRSALPRHRLYVPIAVALVVIGGGGVWAASGSFHSSWSRAAAANPRLELIAGLGFVASLLAATRCWRLVFQALGSRMDLSSSCAAYATGTLVNTFSPARLGDGVRAALFARSLPSRKGRALSAAGAVGALALARAFAHTLLIASAVALGAFSLWPLLGLVGVILVVATAGVVLYRRLGSRFLPAHLFEAGAMLARRPRLGLKLLCWSLVTVAGRFTAAAAVVSSVGLPDPLLAALATTAALDLAGLIPLTPGGIGITGGAVALGLAQRGIGPSTAVAAGLVFQAIAILAGLAFAGTVLAVAACPNRGQRVLAIVTTVGAGSIVVALSVPVFLNAA